MTRVLLAIVAALALYCLRQRAACRHLRIQNENAIAVNVWLRHQLNHSQGK